MACCPISGSFYTAPLRSGSPGLSTSFFAAHKYQVRLYCIQRCCAAVVSAAPVPFIVPQIGRRDLHPCTHSSLWASSVGNAHMGTMESPRGKGWPTGGPCGWRRPQVLLDTKLVLSAATSGHSRLLMCSELCSLNYEIVVGLEGWLSG